MTRIALGINLDPSSVDIVTNIRAIDGSFYRLTAFVDTGADISLLPKRLLPFLQAEIITERIADQAGIAGQEFSAIEARINLFFEDAMGNESEEIQALVLFAETDIELIGFQDILDRATLHIDFRETRTAWIEIQILCVKLFAFSSR